MKAKPVFFAALAVILVIALVFFFQFSSISFAAGKEKISGLWLESSVNVEDSNSLIPSRLSFLKSNLESYRQELNSKLAGTEKNALLSYLDIQLKVVEGLQLQAQLGKDLIVFSQAMETPEKTCGSLETAESIAEKTDALNELNNELILAGRDFAIDFPAFAEEMRGLPSFKLSSKTKLTESVIKLSELCAKEGLV
jgi:hypothetical protein